MQSRVLTFESWATKAKWFEYARSHSTEIRFMLSDRSQCQDPFFDLFAPKVRDRQPMITGLCRCLRNFNVGDRYVYVTRLCREAARERGWIGTAGRWYLGVASLIVASVEPSHGEAARRFSPRRYVAAPAVTPYPPGLAHSVEPDAAASRECCIVHPSKNVSLTPSQSKPDDWRKHYSEYHQRQVEKKLRAAFCRFEVIDGREALAASFEDAPVLTDSDWEDKTPQVMGRHVQDATAKRLAASIAEHGSIID